MASNKFVAFFATEKGQVTSSILALGAFTSSILVKYLPNSFMLEQSREFLQLFKFEPIHHSFLFLN